MTDESRAAYTRLRRLQEHNLSNIPAQIANRALSSFSLQQDPIPEESADIFVMVYPQDPFIGQPEVRRMKAIDIRPGLINARVRIREQTYPIAQPDIEGNYFFMPDTPEFDQINAFYYTTYTLRMFERYARRALPWSFPGARLDVDPHVGDGANAFYSENDRMLGFQGFTKNGQKFVAAQSADVVSHETAHAVLDGLRDLYNESFGLGAMAFHESFGDMTAVLVALHDDSLISKLLDITQGDLRLNNFIASLAEMLSDLPPHEEAHVEEHTLYLRNAINAFHAMPFEEIPYRVSQYDTELGRESHNYSRLFTGAFYDILVGVYEHLRKSISDRIAIHRTRDIMGYLLVGAVESAPVGEVDFADMARAFLAADHYLYNKSYSEILIDAFNRRRILDRSEAQAYVESLNHVPELALPETLNSALAAAQFLEDEVIPKLKIPTDSELTPLATYRNSGGAAYLTFWSQRRLTLKGEQYKQFNGAHIDALGGLTLTFGADGWLRNAVYRPVTDTDVQQIGVMTQDLINYGLIADPLAVGGSPTLPPMHIEEPKPKGLWVPELPADLPPLDAPMQQPKPSKLVKFPVIFDSIPRRLSSFRDYLEKWRK